MAAGYIATISLGQTRLNSDGEIDGTTRFIAKEVNLVKEIESAPFFDRKEDQLAFCASTLVNNYRTGEKIKSINHVVLDVDGSRKSLRAAARKFRDAGVLAILYTTHSNSPASGEFRFKVVLTLDKPLPPNRKKDWLKFVDYGQSILGEEIDECSRIPQQFHWYGKNKSSPFEFQFIEGKCIDDAYDPDLDTYVSPGAALSVLQSIPGLSTSADLLLLGNPHIPDTIEERRKVLSALKKILPNKPRDANEYLSILAALKATGWHDAEDIARKWASGELHAYVEELYNGKHFKRDWNSLKEVRDHGDSIGAGTIFHIAKKYGWSHSQVKPQADGIHLELASDIQPASIVWRWHGFLPGGKLVILAGPSGQGKTTIAICMAAVISVGGKWPDGTRAERGRVLIWSGEDSAEDTLVPRLIAAGADLSMIIFVRNSIELGDRRAFDPAQDMQALSQKLMEIDDLALVIVDPLVSAIAGDSHKASEVRRGLAPLVELAEQRGVTLLGITHFSKASEGRTTVDRVIGSQAFAAAARMVLVVSRLEGPDGEALRVLLRAKSNNSPDDGGFEYRLVQSRLPNHPDITAQHIEWGNVIDGRADDLLAPMKEESQTESARGAARAWLEDLLRKEGPLPARQVFDVAAMAGHNQKTLKRAKADLGVTSTQVSDSSGRRHVWALPAPEGSADDEL